MSSIYKTDEEVEILLNHPKNGLKKIDVEVKIIGKGNHGGQGNGSGKRRDLSIEDKTQIATLAHLIGGKATSEITGTHATHVSQLKNGRNSNSQPEPEVLARMGERIEKISDKALEKVGALIEMFSEEKASELKASEIPGAAEKMAGIFEKISKHNQDLGIGANSKPTVILYAPRQINIDQYISKEV
jgi:hypothetical protein